MIPEIGYFALVLGLCLSVLQIIFPIIGAQTHRVRWMESARPLAFGQFLLVSIAFACLVYAFLQHDFSVRYVAANSNVLLPTLYRFCAVWGAHEGSMLLWLFFLTGWMAFTLLYWKRYPLPFIATALGILGVISTGFLIFLLWTSDPFERLFLFIPQEGRDLNPLLQDPGLVSHPPMLYAGYVGFAVPFAFAIAALMGDRIEKHWARFARPYTLLAWCFLTIGIVLGSWWAYRQLGWGGWWFWDPVENASFMPWLAGVILLHTLIVIEKRAAFNAWGMLMAITAFALSLLGTFIVRSGVLISVHAFAVDPARGLFILAFLGVVVGGALGVYAWHAKKIQAGESFGFFSKETFLLLNNVGLFAALMTIFIGTLYPLLVQVLGLGQLSVGAPYFNKTFGLLMLPILFIMGLAPLVHWRQDQLSRLKRRFIGMLIVSLMAGFLLPYWMVGNVPGLVFIAVSLAVWIGLGLLQVHYRGARFLGMLCAHGGMAISLLGVILSTVYAQSEDVHLSPGDTFEMAGYRFKMLNVYTLSGPNYKGEEANIAVYKSSGVFLEHLKPQIRIYTTQQMALPKAAIEANVFRDIYITLSEPVGKDAWGVRFSYKPFVRWIWMGGLFMALGGMISAFQRQIDRKMYRGSPVIASEARQSRRRSGLPRRFAPRNDG